MFLFFTDTAYTHDPRLKKYKEEKKKKKEEEKRLKEEAAKEKERVSGKNMFLCYYPDPFTPGSMEIVIRNLVLERNISSTKFCQGHQDTF